MTKKTICRHCRLKYANRPRGLCWTCYRTPDVLAQYPVTSKYARDDFREGGDDPTEDQLEKMIAEQRANLPAWWKKS